MERENEEYEETSEHKSDSNHKSNVILSKLVY